MSMIRHHSHSRFSSLLLILTFAVSALFSAEPSTTYIWIGSNNPGKTTDWFTHSNWSGFTPPTASNNVYIGFPPNSNADVLINGASAFSNSAFIGYNDVGVSSVGLVTVSGAGTVWTLRDTSSVAAAMFIGYQAGGDGTLRILNDAEVISGTGHIGYGSTAGSKGLVTVDGGKWSVSGSSNNLYVGGGAGATGEMEIKNGGEVIVGDGVHIGAFTNANGKVTVTGLDSLLQSNGTLFVGSVLYTPSSTVMEIRDQGRVKSGAGYVNEKANVLVDGAGSLWEMSSGLWFNDSNTVLKVTNGGEVRVGFNIYLYGGKIQIGDNSGAGVLTVTGDITNYGVIEFKHTNSAYTFSSAINNSSTGTVEQNGTGTTIFTGTKTYSGNTYVNAGTLLINTALTNSAQVHVANGATLGGTGTISRAVIVNGGGHIAPGASAGTLTVGSLVLNNTSVLDFELGSPIGINDLLNVTGALTLDGILNVSPLSGFGAGVYRLINYGSLTANNGLAFGSTPAGYTYGLDLATAGQVNLLVNAENLQFWDGAGPINDTVVQGGSGIWNTANTNWTNATGSVNAAWDGKFAIFGGASTPRNVTLGSNITFEGIQFTVDGYTILPDAGDLFSLEAMGAAPVIRTDAGLTAIIAAPLISSSEDFTKLGTGTLALTGSSNTLHELYVDEGTLIIRGVTAVLDQGTGSSPGSGDFYVAKTAGSTATLLLENGATLNSRFTIVGNEALSTGYATVGADSTWTVRAGLVLGWSGNAEVEVLSGGTLETLASGTTLARESGSAATVTVTGVDALWDSTGQIVTVGTGGEAKLYVNAGGEVRARSLNIGSYLDASVQGNGEVEVTGPDSKITLNTLLGVGNSGGEGSLLISGGGKVTSANSRIGGSTVVGIPNGTGHITVTDADSSLALTGFFYIGDFWTGTLSILNGGEASSGNTVLGYNENGDGKVLVSGTDSTFTVSALRIADYTNAKGDVTIADNGALTVNGGAGTVQIANVATATGILNVGLYDLTTTAGTLNAASISFGTGTGTLNFNQTNATTFTQNITANVAGTTAINQRGYGVTTLSGTISNIDNVNVINGTLRVNGTLGASGFNVSSGATIGGTGTINAPVTLAANAILAPGASAGTLTFSSLNLNASSILEYELSTPGIVGSGVNDLTIVNGALSLDGLLRVTSLPGFAPGIYRLIDYTDIGAFANNGLIVDEAPIGYDTGDLTVDVSTPNQVNLIVQTSSLQYWDGNNFAADNVVQGGNGTWNNTDTNWTLSDGSTNAEWGEKTAVFTGSAGVVTLGDNITFTNLHFITDGYTINPDAGNSYTLTTNTAGSRIRVAAGATATIAAVITGSGGIVKADPGTLILTGSNSYNGGTQLNGGTLLVGNNSALGSGSVALGAGTTFGVIAGADVELANNVNILGDVNIFAPGTSYLTLTGTVALGSVTRTLTFTENNSIVNLTSDITGAGGLTFRTPAGNTALLTMNGADSNSYAGLTTVGNGIQLHLQKDPATTAIAGNLLIESGGLVQLYDSADQINPASTVTIHGELGLAPLGGVTSQTIANLLGTGRITNYNGASVITVKAGNFSGVISEDVWAGPLALIKNGPGALILSGASTYTGGTTVTEGVLRVRNTTGSATGAGDVIMQGGTLAGDGIISGVVRFTGPAVLSPGNSPGTITLGGLHLNADSTLVFELAKPGVKGGVNDFIQVNGDLTLDGKLAILSIGPGGLYHLIDYTGTFADSGLTIDSVPAGVNPGNLLVDTTTPGEVNLIYALTDGVVDGFLTGHQYWDGSHTSANGMIDGGSGVWTLNETNWTNVQGLVNGKWAGETAVFTARPGIVTLGSDIPFQKLIFEVGGYRIVSSYGFKLYSAGNATIHTSTGRTTLSAPTTVAGVFTKTGRGLLDLRAPFYANATHITAGTLAVNSVLHSPYVNVHHGATLMGSGLIIGNVFNSGTVAPGNSIGTLSIHGNYTQRKSGTLQIEASSTSWHDVLVVSGTTRLAGSLELHSLGYQSRYGDQIPFLLAGKIVGRFDDIEVPLPSRNRGRFFTTANDQLGVLLIAPASYTLVAQTPNEHSLARALDKWIGIEKGDIGAVTLALDLQTKAQYAQSFAAISPSYYEGALSTGIELSHNHNQLLHQQLNARRLAYRIPNVPAMPAPSSTKNPEQVRKAVISELQPQSESDLRWSAWTQGSGLFSSGGLSLTPGESFESGTFLVGADYLLTDALAVGILASYQEGWGDYNQGGDIDLDSVRFGLYATYDSGGFYANTAIGGGQTGYDVKRPIRWAYLDRTATSEPDGWEFFTSASVGYDLKRGNWTFGPQFSVQYSKLTLDEFSEHGAGSLNLRLSDTDIDSLRTYLGGRIAYTYQINQHFAIIPEVRAFWQHEFLDGGSTNARLNGGSGPAFTHTFSDPDEDSIYFGAGLGFQMGSNFYMNLYYNLDLGRREDEAHSVSVSATVRF